MSLFTKLLLERCVRAFAAAAIGVLSIQLANGDVTIDAARTIGVAAIAAGVSAVFSVISQAIGDPASTSFTKASVTE